MNLDQRFARACAVMGTFGPGEIDAMPAMHMMARVAASGALATSTPPVVFHVSPSLAERLDATSDTVSAGEMRLPFEGFAVREGASFYLMARAPEVMGQRALATAWLDGASGVLVVKAAGLFRPDEPVSAQNAAVAGDEAPEHVERAERERLSSLTRIAVGLCHYLATERPDVLGWNGRAPKLDRETIVLPPIRTSARLRHGEVKDAVRARTFRVGTTVPPLHAHANTLVRGHFRWQPHGVGRALRKMIWIQPHVRFRDDTFPTFGRDVGDKPTP